MVIFALAEITENECILLKAKIWPMLHDNLEPVWDRM